MDVKYTKLGVTIFKDHPTKMKWKKPLVAYWNVKQEPERDMYVRTYVCTYEMYCTMYVRTYVHCAIHFE